MAMKIRTKLGEFIVTFTHHTPLVHITHRTSITDMRREYDARMREITNAPLILRFWSNDIEFTTKGVTYTNLSVQVSKHGGYVELWAEGRHKLTKADMTKYAREALQKEVEADLLKFWKVNGELVKQQAIAYYKQDCAAICQQAIYNCQVTLAHILAN